VNFEDAYLGFMEEVSHEFFNRFSWTRVLWKGSVDVDSGSSKMDIVQMSYLVSANVFSSWLLGAV